MYYDNILDKQYMHFSDRRDTKFAWPGNITENWVAPATTNAAHEVLNPNNTLEETQELVEIYNLGMTAVGRDKLTPEVEEKGEWMEEYAPGCEEEPDAPAVRLRIRVPKKSKYEKIPVVLYIFPAGFMYSPECFNKDIGEISASMECAVVAPSYRLYPQHKFPASINDIHAAYNWIVKNGEKYGWDPDNIVLQGLSAGGWFSIAVAHRLKRFGITPKGIVAVGPPLDDRCIGTSGRYEFFGEGMGSRDVAMVINCYMEPGLIGVTSVSPEAYPNHATVEEVRGIAPMAIHLAESDPCRDAGIQYAQKLLDADVFCALHVWPGAHHGTLTPEFDLEKSDLTDPSNVYKLRINDAWHADIEAFFKHDFRRK